MRSVLFASVATLTLAACGSFVPTVDMQTLAPEMKHAVRQIVIYDQNKLQAMEYDILGVAEGHSCQNKMWDPPATRTGAVEQLKYHAWEMGGEGISNIQCGGREGTSAQTNCWELISCTAHVVKPQ